MTQPTNRAVHVDSALTNISVAFLQNTNNFVAGNVFANVPVAKQSDRYFVYDRGSFNRDEAEIRAPGTESVGGGYDLDNTPTYFANVYAFHHDVPDQVRANADPAVDPDRDAANLVAHKLLIRREKIWNSKFFVPGVWNTDRTGVATSPTGSQFLKWSDDNSNPIGNIDEGKATMLENTGMEANTLVLGYRTFDALKRHPEIVDLIKYSGGVSPTNPALITEQALAAVFGVNRVMVSKAIENTAAQGAAESSSFINGGNALLTHTAPAPGLMTPSAGYTFSWSGFMGQGNANGFSVKRFYIDELESTRIEGQMAFDMKVVSSELGVYYGSAV